MFGFVQKIISKNKSTDTDDHIEKLKDDEVEVEMIDSEKNVFGLYIDDFVGADSVGNLVKLYRDSAQNSEIENAIDEICNEAIIVERNSIVSMDLDSTNFSDNIKKKIQTNFEYILSILKFKESSYNLFKKWFIDGRLYVFLHVDEKKKIINYEILEPERIKKRKNKKTKILKYYYEKDNKSGFEIDSDLIIFIDSGITDPDQKYYVSHLHKSLKPLNQLRLLEDSMIIYRITRAPERRVFTIDVGKMSKTKADAYIQKMMNRFRNKIAYDVETGKVTNQKNVMTMLEDFYFPVTESGRGTKVETLTSGQSMTDMQDIFYFKKKLYKSLKIPLSRFDDDNNAVVELGRSGEFSKEELKFSKFIIKLQQKFGTLLFSILKNQLIWSNIINDNDWKENLQNINLIWNADSYFVELKKQEILNSRVETLTSVSEFIGKYFSKKYVYKEILCMSEDEIVDMEKEIDIEKKNGDYVDNEE
jgi:hypothetical protein